MFTVYTRERENERSTLAERIGIKCIWKLFYSRNNKIKTFHLRTIKKRTDNLYIRPNWMHLYYFFSISSILSSLLSFGLWACEHVLSRHREKESESEQVKDKEGAREKWTKKQIFVVRMVRVCTFEPMWEILYSISQKQWTMFMNLLSPKFRMVLLSGPKRIKAGDKNAAKYTTRIRDNNVLCNKYTTLLFFSLFVGVFFRALRSLHPLLLFHSLVLGPFQRWADKEEKREILCIVAE